MENCGDKLSSKLEKIDDRLVEIEKTLVEQHAVLKDHTRRSVANEKAVQILADELKPVLLHVHIVNLLAKVSLALLVSSGFFGFIKWIITK